MAATVRANLAERIGPQRYALWFGAQTQLSIDSQRVTVRAPSVFVRDCLRKKFSDDVQASSRAVVGRELAVAFEVEPTLLLQGARPPRGPSDQGEKPAQTPAAPDRCTGGAEPRRPALAEQPSEWKQAALLTRGGHVPQRAARSLARFVVGPSNEYAFRAAELSAHGRQQASPVLFCGPTGVGKTHLLRAIQQEYRHRFPRTRAIYLSAEQFTTGFVEALRGSGLPSFRQKCRGAELLLVDDLQFFIGKQRTIEELQHTVDTMLAEGRQLVLASDRGVADLRGLGPELASRLAGGLSCQIEPPEYATRFGIVCGLRDEMELAIDDDVLAMIAAQITAGARELRGALHRLEAISFAASGPISRETAEEALRELVRQSTRTVRLADVEQAVCEVFGVEPAQLRSERKGRSLSEPRMLAMWLARKYTRSAWSEIGQFFGRRSHSTVISAHHRVEKLIAAEGEIGLSDKRCAVEEAIRRLETALRTA